VLTLQGETAIRRLGALSAFYTEGRRAFRAGGGPISRLGAGGPTARLRTLQEATLVRCVTVIEAYALDLGAAQVEGRLAWITLNAQVPAEAEAMVNHLRRHRLDRMREWNQVEELWADALGVSLTQFADHQEVDLLRTTRHAIVHGAGHFTPAYRKKAQQKLRALNIDPQRASGAIPLDHADIEAALGLGRRFTLWLDPLV
jgi:hypothetical protein